MKERRIIKVRVDMYEDTKFKIIDTKPERDLIHYIWTRTLTLAGKVNLDGSLYLSENIPYTEETLAIEFNRDVMYIKLAFKVFMELEMIEMTENNVYRVKNFTKHQDSGKNIKKNIDENIVKKDINQESQKTINAEEEKVKVRDEKNSNLETEIDKVQTVENEKVVIKAYGHGDELKKDSDNENKKYHCKDKKDDTTKKLLNSNRSKNRNPSKNKKIVDDLSKEEEKESYLIEFNDGERPIGKGEVLVKTFDFS